MNRIRELRQAKGWTQDDLAERLNSVRQTVGHYETGFRGIDADTICTLCDIFDCTADYLLGRSPLMRMELTPEEESIILAHRRADDRAKDMVRLALDPFWQEESSATETRTA